MSLKYELETNVNLVNFESNKIEISFNENLNKDFVKILSTKLFEWTNKRWIIAFSQLKGDLSVKEEISKGKMNIINEFKNTKKYKKILEIFNDIELVEVEKKMTDFSKILDKAKELENNMKKVKKRLKVLQPRAYLVLIKSR